MYRRLIYLIVISLLMLSNTGKADLAITNGTFDGGTSGGTDVPGWYDLNTNANGTSDWWNTASICTNPGVNPFRNISGMACMLGDDYPSTGIAGRYIYQAIGTKLSSRIYTISIDYGQPTDGNVNRYVSIKVEVYQGSFPGAADNVDITGKGLTLIDSVSSPTVHDVGIGVIHNFTSNLNLSSADTTGTLWIRISNLPGQGTSDRGGWVIIDNVKLTSRLFGSAYDPSPANNSIEIPRDGTVLSWTPGELANTHNIFFGTSLNDVNESTANNLLGTTELYSGLPLDSNSFLLGRLIFDTTYYWKVVEMPGNISGGVWNFKTEQQGYPLLPAAIIDVTAVGGIYPEQDPNSTANGKGLDANDRHSIVLETMWAGQGVGPGSTWIKYEFDKMYMFHDMLVWNYNQESPGEMFGAKDVNISYSQDGNNWTAMPTVTLNQATGDNKCTANSKVELNGAIAKFIKITFLTSYADMDVYGLSEVRFSAEPTRAGAATGTLSPANNATNQAINTALKWTPGRYSVQHYLYVSTDANAVNGVGTLVAPIILSDANAVPGFDLNKRYYWRVDEVNMANAYTTWDGTVRRFDTTQYLVVDAFEVGYGATEANYVWAKWKDGMDVPANGGSVIGKDIAPPGLATIVHGGTRSLKLDYDNTGANTISQITAQSVNLLIGRTDWTVGHPTTLTIWFRGDANAVVTSDELYCTIDGKTAVFSGGLSNFANKGLWAQWDVDLTTLGANLSNIPQITIGIRKAGATGGKGTMYLDDIRLTGLTSLVAAPPIFFEAESYKTISLPLDVNNTVAGASGGRYIQVKPGTTAASNNPPTTGIATYQVTIPAGKYIMYGLAYIQATNQDAFWIRVQGATSSQTLHTSGWCQWNGITFGANWHWVNVWSSTVSNTAVVTWTMPTSGTYTIDIAYRDTDATNPPRLDALMFVRVGN